MKAQLSEFATRLRKTNAVWLGECADHIGAIIHDLDRDDALDVADQLRRVADTLSAYAEGAQNTMGICCSCLDSEWSQATQRVALVRGMAVALRGMAQRVARRAA